MPEITGCVKVAVVAALVVIGLVTILLVASFSSLEYYEYGFARRKSTGTVDTSRVYTYGKYLLGPDYEFKVFPAGSHTVVINNIDAFTSGRGVEVTVSATFQYFLRRQELHLLHKAYDLNYEGVVKSSAVDAIKQSLTDFNKTETFRNRSDVERHMFHAVQTRLGGICCPEYCREKPLDCPFECKTRDCKDETERGIFVDVKYFQLGSVRIPHDLQIQMMESILIKERALREDFIQTAQIVRKETDKKVQQIKNNATEVSRLATAQAEYISTTSRASYTNVVESARSRGLTLLYSSLNISQQAHKSSFDYLRTLKENKHVHLTVDFQQRIAATAWPTR